MSLKHHYSDLINLFDTCFSASLNTRLVKGQDEPIYLPASNACSYHQIIFAHGYFASALHEIAHWLVAGKKRRELEDYGYWYNPDGRDAMQQAQFEQVEIKPQAIEWILSMAAGFEFKVSCDNLNGDCEPDRQLFRKKIYQQVKLMLEHPLPERLHILVDALATFYQQTLPLNIQHFIEVE